MKPIILICLLLIAATSSWSQSLPDTLNRFDAKNRKTGYWLAYVDSSIVKTEKSTAAFGAFESYQNGKLKLPRLAKKNKFEGATITYELDSHVYLDSTLILNGAVRFYYDDSLYLLLNYKNGLLQYSEEHLYEIKDEKYVHEVTETVYMDSLFNNQPYTCLMYTSDDDKTPEYKQYFGKGAYKERIYLVPHITKRSLDKPRVGYTYQHRSFLEVVIQRNTAGLPR